MRRYLITNEPIIPFYDRITPALILNLNLHFCGHTHT